MKANYSSHILESFRKIPTTTISDALDRLNIKGAIIGITPVFHGARIAGPVFTVKEVARKADIAEFRVTEALDRAKPGNVILFDVEGHCRASTWGGLASFSAKRKGVEGVVVNGAVRDIDEIRNMKFPVFARAAVPITGKGRIATISMNIPITIDDVQIHPEDLIIGDDSGIVVVRSEEIDAVLKVAEEIMSKEEKVKEQIIEGKSTAEAERNLKTRI